MRFQLNHSPKSISNLFLSLSGIGIWFFALALVFVSPHYSGATSLEYQQILTEALTNTYDLQIGTTDVDLKTIQVEEAQAAYYPTLAMRFGNEYVYDLAHGSEETAYVGTTYISGSQSTYQHSLSFSLNYNLYDFGVREGKYDNIKRDVDLATYNLAKCKTDIELKVLDLFTQGLRVTYEIKAYREILTRKQEVYGLEQRKYEAGTTQKVQVAEAAVDLADTLKVLTDDRLLLSKTLQDLAVLTRQKYDTETTDFADFSPLAAPSFERPDITKFPEIIAYDIEIRKKTTEYEMVALERYPKLGLYADYKLYGRDDNNFFQSIQDLSRKNTSIGIVIDLPLFQGFATVNKARGLQKEIEKLQLERAKRIAELGAQIDTMIDSARIYRETSDERQRCLDNSGQLRDMAGRLTEQQLAERSYFLRTQVALLEKQLDFRRKKIDWAANTRRLLILAQENKP